MKDSQQKAPEPSPLDEFGPLRFNVTRHASATSGHPGHPQLVGQSIILRDSPAFDRAVAIHLEAQLERPLRQIGSAFKACPELQELNRIRDQLNASRSELSEALEQTQGYSARLEQAVRQGDCASVEENQRALLGRIETVRHRLQVLGRLEFQALANAKAAAADLVLAHLREVAAKSEAAIAEAMGPLMTVIKPHLEKVLVASETIRQCGDLRGLLLVSPGDRIGHLAHFFRLGGIDLPERLPPWQDPVEQRRQEFEAEEHRSNAQFRRDTVRT